MSSLVAEVAGREYVVDEVLTGELEDGQRLAGVEFVGCTLRDSVLAGATLTGVHFERCTFERVDLSRLRMPDVALDGCTFLGCKALATSWSMMRTSVLAPDPTAWIDCLLGMGSFSGLDLTGARFERCSLTDADFADAVLKDVTFGDCTLAGARFVRTDLRGADLSGCRDYVIDVREAQVEGLRLDAAGALGLLAPFGVEIE